MAYRYTPVGQKYTAGIMRLSDLWNSIENLGSLITLANWGIAATLFLGFAFTVVVIKAGNRKDKLTSVEDLSKAQNIANLNAANLVLRGQVATLEINAGQASKDLALLQKAASDSKAAQQRVEIDLSKQQEKTAIAQKDLANLKETIRPRHIDVQQMTALVGLLSVGPKGQVSLSCVMGDAEGNAFATQISNALKSAGWPEAGVTQAAYSGGDPVGFGLVVQNGAKAPSYATHLQQAFFSIGLPIAGVQDPKMQEDSVQIVVGHKPTPRI